MHKIVCQPPKQRNLLLCRVAMCSIKSLWKWQKWRQKFSDKLYANIQIKKVIIAPRSDVFYKKPEEVIKMEKTIFRQIVRQNPKQTCYCSAQQCVL